MHDRPIRSHGDRPSRHPQRGAVFLLYCYLVSLTLFILMTVMFTRSANEIRLTERSAQLSQAFWAAEAAMDAAIEALKTQPEPSLFISQCTSPQATKVTGATYQLCLETPQAPPGAVFFRTRYRIEATGTRAGMRETLTAQVNRQVNTVQFDRVISAAGHISYINGFTGGMDTSRSRLLANTTFRGDLASRGNSVRDGSIQLEYSLVQGDAYVKTDGDPAARVSVGGTSWDPSRVTSTITGSIRTLESPPALPSVTVPSYAVNIGDSRGNLQVGGHTYGPEGSPCYNGCPQPRKQCLEPGTYKVHHLLIGASWSMGVDPNIQPEWIIINSNRSELCTTGPVDLYVTGHLQVVNGELYGQPAGSRPGDKQYSPQDLRIFFAPDSSSQFNNYIFVGILGSPVIAGTIYAPNHHLVLAGLDGRLLGGAIVGDVLLWGAGAGFGDGSSTVGGSPSDFWTFYDEQLRNRPFQVGPTEVTMLMWGRGSQLASATTTTPTTPTTTPPTAAAPTTTTPPSLGGIKTVICTEMHRQGFLPETWYAADAAFGARLEPATLAVYQSWATPVVGAMQRSTLVTALVKPFAYAWAQHMAYEMGVSPSDSVLGAALNAVGLPLHRALGKRLVQDHAIVSIAQ